MIARMIVASKGLRNFVVGSIQRGIVAVGYSVFSMWVNGSNDCVGGMDADMRS